MDNIYPVNIGIYLPVCGKFVEDKILQKEGKLRNMCFLGQKHILQHCFFRFLKPDRPEEERSTSCS